MPTHLEKKAVPVFVHFDLTLVVLIDLSSTYYVKAHCQMFRTQQLSHHRCPFGVMVVLAAVVHLGSGRKGAGLERMFWHVLRPSHCMGSQPWGVTTRCCLWGLINETDMGV